jgi:hypothetical protein
MLRAAMTELARAERKLAKLDGMSAKYDLPPWFVAREEAEAAAGALVESLYEQIAETRAHSKAGLAIKLRLVATLYGDDPTTAQDDYDVDAASRLLRSIILDVSTADISRN